MYKVLVALYFFILSAVYADPFLLDKELKPKEDRAVHYEHFTYVDGTAFNSPKVRFAYMVPKLGSEFKEGFLSVANGVPKELHFKLDDGELLSELVAVSNCKGWYSALLKVWNKDTKQVYYKGYALELKSNGDYSEKNYVDYNGLGDYLYENLTKALYDGLVSKGVPSNPLLLYLKGKYNY